MKEKTQNKFFKFLDTAKRLPDKKHHLDFVAALLTIPVLLSVIILNYTNLNNMQKLKTTPTPTNAPVTLLPNKQQIIVVPQNAIQQATPSATPPPQSCQKDIGPVTISYPSEGQTVSDNPLCVNISYDNLNYCSVVWSYRINNGQWSDFNSNNPCIYNLPNGSVKFDLRIQSTVIQKEVDLTRNFTYDGNSLATPTPATSSASTQ